MNHRLASQFELLQKENALLRERLAKHGIPKNSRNSSLAPSSDMNPPKRNQSLRKKTGRKPGGQLGREGKTLEMVADPDHIEDFLPQYCTVCGKDISDVPSRPEERRQVVDIPPIRAKVTEYRSYSRVCPCGNCTIGQFPSSAVSSICYGPNIEAMAGYLHTRQYLPYKRMAELFGNLLGTPISQGGIRLLLGRFALKALPAYQEIRRRISGSPIVGSDETGAKVNGERHWFWTWQNKSLTYIAHSPSRSSTAVTDNFPSGLPKSILVHDCWNPQRSTPGKAHQICLAHLLRDIEYLKHRFPKERWPVDIGSLLSDAIELSREGPAPKERSVHLSDRLQKLIQDPPEKDRKELFAFYRRIRKEQGNLFTFLKHHGVPFDNNASERAIRNIKVKQKISGQFKTEKGAREFAIIRSVIDTTIKNGQNVLEALSLIAKLEPQTLG